MYHPEAEALPQCPKGYPSFLLKQLRDPATFYTKEMVSEYCPRIVISGEFSEFMRKLSRSKTFVTLVSSITWILFLECVFMSLPGVASSLHHSLQLAVVISLYASMDNHVSAKCSLPV